MKLCPVSIAIGCTKRPIYKPCPLKGVIGDHAPQEVAKAEKAAMPAKGKSGKK
jgi:hypothetical protein